MRAAYQEILEEHQARLASGDVDAGSDELHSLSPFLFVPAPRQDETQEDTEDRILDWLTGTLDVLSEENSTRFNRMIANVNFYNMMTFFDGKNLRLKDQDGQRIRGNQMFFMNHARDLLRQSVSRLMRYTPTLQVFPNNNEYGDRLGARLSKNIVDHIFRISDMRDLAEDCLRDGKLCGEQFCFVEYDPFIGDLDVQVQQMLQQAEASGEKLTYKERNGQKFFEDSQGERISIEAIKRTGEVSLTREPPWFIVKEPNQRWRDTHYIFRGRIKHVDIVRAENPDIDIDPDTILRGRSGKLSHLGPGFASGEWIIEWDFYHRGCRFLDKGFHARFISGQLLAYGDNPFSHRGLPCARFSDIDDPWSSNGISFFEDIKTPIIIYNRLQNAMYRNIAIGSAPKIMVPEGASNPYAMRGGPFIIPYEPPYEPKALTVNTIGGEVFQFSDNVMRQVQQLSGTFGISRGDVPNNARAASILNFYEEQENEKEQSNIRKYNAFIEKLGKLALATAGDFYRAEDNRTIRVVGKNNRYKIKKVQDVSKLSSPYDVQVERTTALAETKQGRIDQIVALSQMPMSTSEGDAMKPGLFTREQILNMIEVSDTPAFFELATAAVDKAQSENEDMFEGVQIEPPMPTDAHLLHWREHFFFLQSREFSEVTGVPPQVRQAFEDHLMAHEAILYLQATRSLSMAQSLMELPYFPVLFDFGDKPTLAQLIMMHQSPPAPVGPQAGARNAESAQLPPEGEEEVQQEPDIPEEPLPEEAIIEE